MTRHRSISRWSTPGTEALWAEQFNAATKQTLKQAGSVLRETLRKVTIYSQMTKYGHSGKHVAVCEERAT
jgi:hypothetical protein